MTAEQLVKDFSGKPAGWKFERLVSTLRAGSSAEIERFIELVIVRRPEGGTFFDMAISHVSDQALDRLVPVAIEGLELEGPHDACESLLAHASLQRPQALHPHLRRLFELRPNKGHYHENWPWREAGPEVIPFLAEQLKDSPSQDTQSKARNCLLELRTAEAFAVAGASAEDLQGVGHRSPTEPLYFARGSHIIFEPDYFQRELPIWMSHGLHPTWRLESEHDRRRIGGEGSSACRLCGGSLHHLLTVPAKRVFPGTAHREETVSLETCLACVGPPLFYHHDVEGLPHSLYGGRVAPAPLAIPLKDGWVRLATTHDRWRWQDWALASGRENLNRLGGYPSWIQSAEFPRCPVCDKAMHFLLQLDSYLPASGGGERLWGNGGICYGFRCEPCRTTAFLWQCT